MSKFLKVSAIAIAIIVGSILAIFFDNIKGYYRFKQYCANEGGLRIHEPLEKNVGWLADDKYDARLTAGLSYVGFVRYADKEKLIDLFVIGKRNKLTLKFEEKNADTDKPILYKLNVGGFAGVDGVSPGKISYQVLSVNNELKVAYNSFFYKFFNGEKMPMGVNQKFSCFVGDENSLRSRWESEINSSFVGN